MCQNPLKIKKINKSKAKRYAHQAIFINSVERNVINIFFPQKFSIDLFMLYIKKGVNIMYIKRWFVHLPVCMFKMNYFSKFTRFIYVCNCRNRCENIFFTRSPKILQFDRIKNYLYSMSGFYQTCWKMVFGILFDRFFNYF